MKKLIIGSAVGGIILFLIQFLSWGLLDLHRSAFEYTPHQQEILDFLASKNLPEGGYFLPTVPSSASMEEYDEHMKLSEGKPWAVLTFHNSMETKMGMNMFRGFLVDVVIAFCFCWIALRLNKRTFSQILISSILTGLIIFLYSHYTESIWYGSNDLMADFADTVGGWAIAGLWFGWWLKEKRAAYIR